MNAKTISIGPWKTGDEQTAAMLPQTGVAGTAPPPHRTRRPMHQYGRLVAKKSRRPRKERPAICSSGGCRSGKDPSARAHCSSAASSSEPMRPGLRDGLGPCAAQIIVAKHHAVPSARRCPSQNPRAGGDT
eukprot:2417467-Prymnesium_polylepis.2